MNPFNRTSAFASMNKPKYQALSNPGDYRAWKNKDVTKDEKKELNMASFSDFPDLVVNSSKKTVFEGTSLAMKLKDVIAAEEEEAIQKRLKKGDTPEMILREGCVSLPLKGSKRASTDPLVVPWWVTDDMKPIVIPPFHHKTLAELAEERRLKRYGIDHWNTMLYDEPEEEDRLSVPSMPEMEYENEFEEEYEAYDTNEDTLVTN
jgi:hypothetical protein